MKLDSKLTDIADLNYGTISPEGRMVDIMRNLDELFFPNIENFINELRQFKSSSNWHRYLAGLAGLKACGIEIPDDVLPNDDELNGGIAACMINNNITGRFGPDYGPILLTLALPEFTKQIAIDRRWVNSIHESLDIGAGSILSYCTVLNLWGENIALPEYKEEETIASFNQAIRVPYPIRIMVILANARISSPRLFAEFMDYPINWDVVYTEMDKYLAQNQTEMFLSLYGYMRIAASSRIEIKPDGLHLTDSGAEQTQLSVPAILSY